MVDVCFLKVAVSNVKPDPIKQIKKDIARTSVAEQCLSLQNTMVSYVLFIVALFLCFLGSLFPDCLDDLYQPDQ